LATPQCYQTGWERSCRAQMTPECSIVRLPLGLYNQGDWRSQADRQPMALKLHLYKRVAPEERGRTWKSV
jgi:hypothetical protein